MKKSKAKSKPIREEKPAKDDGSVPNQAKPVENKPNYHHGNVYRGNGRGIHGDVGASSGGGAVYTDTVVEGNAALICGNVPPEIAKLMIEQNKAETMRRNTENFSPPPQDPRVMAFSRAWTLSPEGSAPLPDRGYLRQEYGAVPQPPQPRLMTSYGYGLVSPNAWPVGQGTYQPYSDISQSQYWVTDLQPIHNPNQYYSGPRYP